MNTQGRGRNNRSRQEDPIQDIINRVKNTASLKEVLDQKIMRYIMVGRIGLQKC